MILRVGHVIDEQPWAVAALAVTGAAAATLAGAWFFELVIGLDPCPLCLEQRLPYYAVMPLGGLVALSAWRQWPACVTRVGLVLMALIMVWAMRLGVYHAGAEWGFWPGPTSCATPVQTLANPADLLRSLQTARVVDCTVAAWRFAGLSLAGWNVVIAAGLAGVALAAAARVPVRRS